MSMEIFVLSNRQLPSITAWQDAIDAERFRLRLSIERPFQALRGLLPASWDGERTGFECDHWSLEDIREGYEEIDLGGTWEFVLAFRWGANVLSAQSAWMAAGAYAKTAEGVVFDPDQGIVHSAENALEEARRFERERPEMERSLRELLDRIRRQFERP